MTFIDRWNEIMGKQTTTTFKVTLKYAGPKKDIGKLLRTYQNTTIVKAEELDSNTVKTEVQAYYSDTQKLTRAFLKQALENTKLKYVAGSDAVEAGTYNLKYGSSYNKGIVVILHGVRVNLFLVDRNRADLFDVEIWDFEDPKAETPSPDPSATSWKWASYRRPFPNEKLQVSIADPAASDTFTDLFKKWGYKYTGALTSS